MAAPVFMLVRAGVMADTAVREATVGDPATADALVAAASAVRSTGTPIVSARQLAATSDRCDGETAGRPDCIRARRSRDSAQPGNQRRSELRVAKPDGSHETFQKANIMYSAALISTRVDFERGDYAAAEKSAREALENRKIVSDGAVQDFWDQAEISIWLTMALVRQGRLTEAAPDNRPCSRVPTEPGGPESRRSVVTSRARQCVVCPGTDGSQAGTGLVAGGGCPDGEVARLHAESSRRPPMAHADTTGPG